MVELDICCIFQSAEQITVIYDKTKAILEVLKIP